MFGTMVAFRGIAEGVENSNYSLRTSAGDFILTLYEKRVDPTELPWFLGLMEHLALRGLVCPQPVHGRDGSRCGTCVDATRQSPHFCQASGRAASAHRALRTAGLCTGLAAPRGNGLQAAAVQRAWTDQAGCRCCNAAERALMRCSRVWRPSWTVAAADPGRLARRAAGGAYPRRSVPRQRLFLNNRLSGIIDFYFAATDLLAYDVAVCLNAWCFEADFSFNVTKGRALLAAYHAVRPLSAPEQAALPVLCQGAAIRFLLTRLFDWLNQPAGALVTRKDPLEYLRRLRFHLSAKDAHAYGF